MKRTKQLEKGKVFDTLHWGQLTIIDDINSYTVKIRFIDTGFENTVYRQDILNGRVKDYLKPYLYGVGYLGEQRSRKGNEKIYSIWHRMILRCYDPYAINKHLTYKDCTVHPEWHDFRNFISWHNKQRYIKGYQLDKDLFVEGNKIYGPSTCFYVPKWLNLIQIPFVTTGKPLGVFKKEDSYEASLSINNTYVYIGKYSTPGEASNAYLSFKSKYIHAKLISTSDYIPRVLLKELLHRCFIRVKEAKLVPKHVLTIMKINQDNKVN